MMASDIGITIISFNEKLSLFEETIMTMRIEEIIVVGTEYFFIPKYSGMRHMPDAAIAFINTAGVCCAIMPIVKVPGIKLKLIGHKRKHRCYKQIRNDDGTECKQDDNG